MRTSRRVWVMFSMLCGLEGVLAGQAMVEYGVGAGRAATTAAPARGVSNAIGGVMGSLEKVLKTGQEATETSTPGVSRGTEPAQPGGSQRARLAPPGAKAAVPDPVYEDPAGIVAGMSNDELVRRFGPPALEVTGASSSRIVTYRGKSGLLELELRGEKVSRITAMNSHQAALVLPAGPGPRP